jgi:hypothetical protein
MVSVIVIVLDPVFGLAAGFGATLTFGAGEQVDWIHLSAASADLGMLASCEELGQLTGWATGLGAGLLTVLAAGFGAGFGAGLGFGAGTTTVLVMVLVVVDPAELVDEPTQTVTEPEPMLDP